MKNKNKIISIRLNTEEYTLLDNNSRNLNMSTSNYIRSLIMDTVPCSKNYNQEIACALCKIRICLEAHHIEDEAIEKELGAICQMLS